MNELINKIEDQINGQEKCGGTAVLLLTTYEIDQILNTLKSIA